MRKVRHFCLVFLLLSFGLLSIALFINIKFAKNEANFDQLYLMATLDWKEQGFKRIAPLPANNMIASHYFKRRAAEMEDEIVKRGDGIAILFYYAIRHESISFEEARYHSDLLIAQGANVNYVTERDGCSQIRASLSFISLQAAKYFYRKGADLNISSNFPFSKSNICTWPLEDILAKFGEPEEW